MPVVSIPNVGDVTFPDGMSQQDILAAIERDILPYSDQFKQPEAPGFLGSLGHAAKESLVGPGRAISAMMSPEDVQKQQALIEGAKQPGSVSWEDVKAAEGIGDTLSKGYEYAKETLGGTLGGLGLPVALGTAARIGATILAPEATPLIWGSQLAGTALGFGAQHFSNDVAQQATQREAQRAKGETPQPYDVSHLLTATAADTALDMAMMHYGGMGRLLGMEGKSAAEKQAAQIVKDTSTATEGRLGSLARGAGQMTIAGVPTMVAETVIDRWQAGLDLASPEAMQQYEGAAVGAVVSSPIGYFGRRSEVGAAKGRVAEEAQRQADAIVAKDAQERADRTNTLRGNLEDRMNEFNAQAARTAERDQHVMNLQDRMAEFNQAQQEAQARQQLAPGARAAAAATPLDLLNTPDGIGQILKTPGQFFPTATPKELTGIVKQLRTLRADLTATMKSDAEKASKSALATAPTDLFGEITPTTARADIDATGKPIVRPITEPTVETALPGQKRLPLEEPLQPNRITVDTLKEWGLPPQAVHGKNIGKQLVDLDLNNPADVQTAHSILSGYADINESPGVAAKLEPLLTKLSNQIDHLEFQKQPTGTQADFGFRPEAPAEIAERPPIEDLLAQYRDARAKGDADTATDIEDYAKELYPDKWRKLKYDAISRRQGKLDFEGRLAEAEDKLTEATGEKPKTAPEAAEVIDEQRIAPEAGIGREGIGAEPEAGRAGVGVAAKPEEVPPAGIESLVAERVEPTAPSAVEAGAGEGAQHGALDVFNALQDISAKEGRTAIGIAARKLIEHSKLNTSGVAEAANDFLHTVSTAFTARRKQQLETEAAISKKPTERVVEDLEDQIEAERNKPNPNFFNLLVLENKLAAAEESSHAAFIKEEVNRVSRAYSDIIKSLPRKRMEINKILAKTKYPNSLEARELRKLNDGLQDYIDQFNEAKSSYVTHSQFVGFDSLMRVLPHDLQAIESVSKELVSEPKGKKAAAAPAKEKPVKKQITDLEAKIDAEYSKDAPNFHLIEALENKLSSMKRGATAKVPLDLRQAFEEARAQAEKEPELRTEEKGNTSPEFKQHVEAGNLRKALSTIAEGKEFTVFEKLVAKRLLASGKFSKLEVVPEGTYDKELAGKFLTDQDLIHIVKGNEDAHTVLHEAIHGYVHAAIGRFIDGRFDHPGLRDLDALYKWLRKEHPELAGEYGMRNLSEFASEAMSNPRFQEALFDIPYKNIARRAWDWFSNAIRKLLNIDPSKNNNALMEALLNVASVMPEGREIQRQTTGTPEFAESKPAMAAAAKQTEGDRILASAGRTVPDLKTPQSFAKRATEVIKNAGNAQNKIQKSLDWLNTQLDIAFPFTKKFSPLYQSEAERATKLGLIAQIGHFNAEASEALQEGGISLPKDGFFSTVASEANGKAIQKSLTDMAGKYGITYHQARAYLNNLLEARRVDDLYKEQAAQLRNAAILETNPKTRAQAQRIKDKWEGKVQHMSWDQAKKLIELEKAYPELKKVVETKNAMRNWILDFAVNTGLMSRERADWLLSNADWVPFYREFDENELMSMDGVHNSITKLQSTFGQPKMKFSERPVADALDNFERWSMYVLKNGMRNHTTRLLASDAVRLSEGADAQFVSRVPTGAENRAVHFFDFDPNTQNTIRRTVLFENPLEAAMFNANLANPRVSSLVRGMNAIFRNSIIAAPTFSAKQLAMDTQTAMQNAGLPPEIAAKLPGMVAKEMASLLKGERSEAHKVLRARGLVGPGTDIGILSAADLQKATGYRGDKLAQTQSILGKLRDKGLEVAMHADNAVRQAVYNAAKEAKWSDAEAIKLAADIINFRRTSGSKLMRNLGAYVPFFRGAEAAIRADLMVLSGRGLKGFAATPEAKAEVLKRYGQNMAMLTALSLLFAMGSGDDDEYKRMSPEQRARQLTIPGMGGWGIPRRVSLPSLIPISVEMMYNQTTDKAIDPARLRTALASVAWQSVALPTPLPAPAMAAIKQVTNYDPFTGDPLVSHTLSQQEAWRQLSTSTSSLAKGWGEAMHAIGLGNFSLFGVSPASPVRVDSAIRDVLGTAGTMGLLAGNLTASVVGNRPTPTLNDFVASVPGLVMPGAKEFNNAQKSDLYDASKKLTEIINTANAMKREGRAEEYQKYVQENTDKIIAAKQAEKVTEQLAKIRKQINIVSSSNIPNDQKTEEIRRLKTIESNFIKNIDVYRIRGAL